MIDAITREAMIEMFTAQCAYYERIAKSSLETTTLTGQELAECVADADNDVLDAYGFRIRDIFVS